MVSGNRGDDTLIGGAGADTFFAGFANNTGHDVITDYDSSAGDKIAVGDINLLQSIFQDGRDILINFSNDSTLRLENHNSINDLQIVDFDNGTTVSNQSLSLLAMHDLSATAIP